MTQNFILNYFFKIYSCAFRNSSFQMRWKRSGLKVPFVKWGNCTGSLRWIAGVSHILILRLLQALQKKRNRRCKRGTKELRWMCLGSRWENVCESCNPIGPALTNRRQPAVSYEHSVLTCNKLSNRERNLVPSTMNRAILSQSLAAVAAKLRSLTALR